MQPLSVSQAVGRGFSQEPAARLIRSPDAVLASARRARRDRWRPPFRSLGLYDLLAPEFLAGFSFPSYIDQYLSLLAASGLTMTSDDTGVLYTGTVYFPTGSGSSAPVTRHTDPSGAVFEWSDINFQFRLRAWREGSSALQTVVNTISSGSNSLETLFNSFGSAGANSEGSDYPGLRFRLELLVSC